jgi:opacity protein-like surface antigen
MNSIAEYCRRLALSVALAVVMLSSSATAQLAPPTGASYGGSVPNSRKVVPGIAWYGVLTEGLAEAKRTGKPILFITAAPQCRGVPGMW